MGQNLKAKNCTYFRTERVTYTTYGPNSTKPSKKAQNTKELLSLSLCLWHAPSPRLRVHSSAPPALGPPPVPQTGVRQFGSLLPTSPSRQRQLRQWQSAGTSPPQRQRLSSSMKEAAHWLLLWICYGHDNLIVHYIAY